MHAHACTSHATLTTAAYMPKALVDIFGGSRRALRAVACATGLISCDLLVAVGCCSFGDLSLHERTSWTCLLWSGMTEHPAVQTCGLFEHALCTCVSVDSARRVLLSFKQKHPIFLKASGVVQPLDLSSIATSSTAAQSIISATIHNTGDSVFVSTVDKDFLCMMMEALGWQHGWWRTLCFRRLGASQRCMQQVGRSSHATHCLHA